MNLVYASSPHEFIGNYKLKHECNGVSDIPHPCKYGGFKFVKSISLFGVVTVGKLSNACWATRYGIAALKALKSVIANLVSFTYAGDWIRLFLWNVPRLAEVSLAYDSRASTVSVFSKLHSCHPQLEVLTLKTSLIHKENYTFPGLEILKHLEVKIATDEDCCLLQLASFIKASPELQKLVLEVSSNMVDRISELPDVILVTIVSCLRALKEKVATSILSKRWRYVWVYTTTLDFGGPDDMQIDAYVKRVNSVVDQHRGGNVEQFRVYIDLVDERYKKFNR
ncbi:hypothetical protein GBA52_028365 [Prunus armeniaca]|nr:hypothetical protein GBA52_028365 [Prunus armeniaca]